MAETLESKKFKTKKKKKKAHGEIGGLIVGDGVEDNGGDIGDEVRRFAPERGKIAHFREKKKTPSYIWENTRRSSISAPLRSRRINRVRDRSGDEGEDEMGIKAKHTNSVV